MAIYKLIANGSFGPDEIEVMRAAYEAALIDVGVTKPDEPITDLIAKSIVIVTATGERNERSNGTRIECLRRSEVCWIRTSKFAHRRRGLSSSAILVR